MRSVTSECIGCEMCCNESKHLFAMDTESHHSYVLNQPETPEEIEEYERIKGMCPMEAIV